MAARRQALSQTCEIIVSPKESNGFAGMILGFQLWADANLAITSNNASGAAFSREAIKLVTKRPFRIDIQEDVAEVATKIVGTEMWGEAILRNKSGNEMQFDTLG